MNEAQKSLLQQWSHTWPQALQAWSSFTKLQPPIYCFTEGEEQKEGLTSSFAMIRLRDHRIVISLRQVADLGLQDFALEILAHEIGHHVFVPADLRDHGRVLARIRAALGSTLADHFGPVVANLWADLLINDRLQRRGHNHAMIYQKLGTPDGPTPSPLWTLYLRTYEHLWGLPRGQLALDFQIPIIDGDAILAARLVRSYSREWVDGAGKFAALLLPFLAKQIAQGLARATRFPWLDSLAAGEGGDMPDGLATIEEGELTAIGHPALDDDLFGAQNSTTEASPDNALNRGSQSVPPAASTGRASTGGQKNRYRPPTQFRELMESLGVQISDQQLVIRYYRELARPHLSTFPTREAPAATEPIPGGVEVWETGYPVSAIDWVATATISPVIIAGYTTVQRRQEQSPGSAPDQKPPDLYLGVDCSGSMLNPARSLSYPVLAGTVITLSALRAGARVKTCLSGEPGEYSQTDTFSRNSQTNLKVLTGYLGTGYAFGLQRLVDQFLTGHAPEHAVHILLVTDFDIISMLGEYFLLDQQTLSGWDVAEQALHRAGGGATVVIQGSPTPYYDKSIERLCAIGWSVHFVQTEQDLLRFARAFSLDYS